MWSLRSVCAGVLLVVALSACSSPEKRAKEQASWDATARMTISAWLAGSVSTRFAADTLQAGGRQTRSARYEAARQAILKNDRAGARAAFRR